VKTDVEEDAEVPEAGDESQRSVALGMTQFCVLLAIRRFGPSSVSDIWRQLDTIGARAARQNVHGAIVSLEKLQFISSEKVAGFRPRRICSLTDAGVEIAREYARVIAELLRRE